MREPRKTVRLISHANPVRDDCVAALVPPEWAEALLTEILADPGLESVRREHRTDRQPQIARGRWLLLATIIALGALAAPAFGVYRNIVDFFDAEPAPARVQLEFGAMEVGSPLGKGLELLPLTPRKVMEREIGGEKRALWVVPTVEGGFCWAWPDFLAACARRSRSIGVTRVESKDKPGLIGGHIRQSATQHLELRYEDGTTVEIPFIWVTAPIDAGLFVFEVPREHLARGRRAKTLVALGNDARELARYDFLVADPALELGSDGLPMSADRDRKRTLIDFEGEEGRRWRLTAAPAPGNRLCYTYYVGSGCRALDSAPGDLDVRVQNTGRAVIVFATLGDAVVDVEMMFEDHTSVRVKPVEGFVLWEIPRFRYGRGHRLTAVVGHGSAGRATVRVDVDERRPGVYPCAEPTDLGYGVAICP